MANELGLRNVAFEVGDLQAAVDWAATEGYGLVSGIGEYEGAWRMAYVRGRKGSSSHWPSASAEPRNARICRVEYAILIASHEVCILFRSSLARPDPVVR